MAEEVGIVMSLYDRVSPTLKAIAGNTAAFDKNLDDLEESLKAYDKAQDTMTKRSADLKKALAEADQQVKTAQKSYRKLNDEASKRDLDSAIDRQTELRRELQETEASLKANSKAYEDLYNKARKAANGIQDTSDAISKADNRAGSVASGGGMLSALGKAGLISQLGDSIGEASGVFLESALGQPTASAVSSILSGAATGAAAGSMLGAPGIAVGALVGGVAGAISGGSQVYQERDEAFRGYVQDAVEGQLSEMDSIRSSGSVTAGQREQDQIAFAQRLGSDQSARDYLAQVREMATGTNYTYDEITGYSKSLLNTYDPEETFSVLQKLSDATAGLNLDSSGVEMFIAALSRMRTTGKLTQEYMNYFSERGLDADEAIARGLGVDKSRVREMATSGEIGGTEAAQAILDYIQEEFGGLSEKLKSTYDAMVDNLGDAEANLNARMGEGYNETRKVGIEAQMDWLESDRLGEAYEAIGAWKAEIENAKEQYIRDAVNEAMGSEEYETAQAEGDAAEMGRIIMQAKIRGMDEYNANEGKDEVLAQELSLIQGVREDAALNDSYWDAGYTLGQEFSKGRAAGMGLQGQEGVPTGPYNSAAEGGTDTESDEALYGRIDEARKRPDTSGNGWDYRAWCLEVEGVGEAKVVELPDGPGTVGITIVDSNYQGASEEIVAAVEANIQHWRPVGASVTVEAAEDLPVSVTAAVVASGTTAAEVQAQLEGKLAEYCRTLIRQKYQTIYYVSESDTDYTLYYNRVLALLLTIPGVQTFTILTVNGGEADITIPAGSVPIVGEVSVT